MFKTDLLKSKLDQLQTMAYFNRQIEYLQGTIYDFSCHRNMQLVASRLSFNDNDDSSLMSDNCYID